MVSAPLFNSNRKNIVLNIIYNIYSKILFAEGDFLTYFPCHISVNKYFSNRLKMFKLHKR